MSQQSVPYCEVTPVTLEAFKNRRCTLPCSDLNYLAPTPHEIKSLRNFLGFSQARLGAFLGKSYNKKGCKAVRRWEASKSNKENNPIDYCSWQLMLIAGGLVNITERAKASEDYLIVMNR